MADGTRSKTTDEISKLQAKFNENMGRFRSEILDEIGQMRIQHKTDLERYQRDILRNSSKSYTDPPTMDLQPLSFVDDVASCNYSELEAETTGELHSDEELTVTELLASSEMMDFDDINDNDSPNSADMHNFEEPTVSKSGLQVLSIHCTHMATKWRPVLDSQPIQGNNMSVEAYYDRFFNWKRKLEEVNYICGEESYVDDFIYGLEIKLGMRVCGYKWKPHTLYGAFRRAVIEESLMKNNAVMVFEEMPHPTSTKDQGTEDVVLDASDEGWNIVLDTSVGSAFKLRDSLMEEDNEPRQLLLQTSTGLNEENAFDECVVLSLNELQAAYGFLGDTTMNGSSNGSTKAWLVGEALIIEVVFGKKSMKKDASIMINEMHPTFKADAMNELIMAPYIRGVDGLMMFIFDPGINSLPLTVCASLKSSEMPSSSAVALWFAEVLFCFNLDGCCLFYNGCDYSDFNVAQGDSCFNTFTYVFVVFSNLSSYTTQALGYKGVVLWVSFSNLLSRSRLESILLVVGPRTNANKGQLNENIGQRNLHGSVGNINIHFKAAVMLSHRDPLGDDVHRDSLSKSLFEGANSMLLSKCLYCWTLPWDRSTNELRFMSSFESKISWLSPLRVNFVWDPGKDVTPFYIIEDNDVLKRKGIWIQLVWSLKQEDDYLNGASAHYYTHMGLLACSLVDWELLSLLLTSSEFQIKRLYSLMKLLVKSVICNSIDPNGVKHSKKVDDKLPQKMSMELNKEMYTIHVDAECWKTFYTISLNAATFCVADKLQLEEFHKNKLLWRYAGLIDITYHIIFEGWLHTCYLSMVELCQWLKYLSMGIVVRIGNNEMHWSSADCSKATFFLLELRSSNVAYINVVQRDVYGDVQNRVALGTWLQIRNEDSGGCCMLVNLLGFVWDPGLQMSIMEEESDNQHLGFWFGAMVPCINLGVGLVPCEL